MTTTIAQKALGIGAHSPFPQSFDGSGGLFWFSLFSLIVIPALATMLGTMLGNHLYHDRKYGFDAVAALRALVLAVCITAIVRCAPEVCYMISYSEATPQALQTILSIKRAAEAVSLLPVLFWMGTFVVFYPEIVLKLRSPTSSIWQDHKLSSLKRFIAVVILAAALAGSVTLGIATR